MLKHHQFAINGSPTSQFNQPVKAGDELWVNFDGSFHVFSHPRIKLVYEDADMMVVDKGYGVLSTAAGNNIKDETVYNVLRKYVKLRSEHARVYMVHRLDRDTSGLMIVARTAKAREKFLTEWATIVPWWMGMWSKIKAWCKIICVMPTIMRCALLPTPTRAASLPPHATRCCSALRASPGCSSLCATGIKISCECT